MIILTDNLIVRTRSLYIVRPVSTVDQCRAFLPPLSNGHVSDHGILCSPMETFSEICICGRSFSQVYAYSNHKRSCQKSKKRLSSALATAKVAWSQRKRPRADVPLPQSARDLDEDTPIQVHRYLDFLPVDRQLTSCRRQ
jgi:hypothetical protein